MNTGKNVRWLALALVVIVLDQLTKWLVVGTMDYRSGFNVFEVGAFGFNMVYVHNYGAAFSFLADQSGWQRWFFALIALGVTVGLTWRISVIESWRRWQLASMALLIGGAIGNCYDRVMHGYVIDFLDFYWGAYHWPAFNVADMAIVAGAALLILEGWLDRPASGSST